MILYRVISFMICMLLATIALLTAGSNGNQIYEMNTAFKDVTSTFGWRISVRSRIHCGQICERNVTCSSFFFVDGTQKTCQLLNVVLPHSSVTTISTAGALYFSPALSSANETSANFTTVILPDNTYFTYSIMSQIANDTQAHESCTNEGSILAEVVTQAKFDYLRNLLNQTQEQYQVSNSTLSLYRVDGTNINATGYGNMGAWRTTTSSTTIPDQFFHPMFLNMTEYSCVYIYYGVDYYFINGPCYHPDYFICEK